MIPGDKNMQLGQVARVHVSVKGFQAPPPPPPNLSAQRQ